jgi:hypothetical protein
MIDIFGRLARIGDVIAYRISNCKSKIALGKIIEIDGEFIRVKSIVNLNGELVVRSNSTIKNSTIVIVNDDFINYKLGVINGENIRRRRTRKNNNKITNN